MLRHPVPGDLISLIAQGEDRLHRDIHDHHALSAQLEGQDLERVRDQQAREADIVEYAE